MGWANPRWNSLKGPDAEDLRAIFLSLQDFLDRPVFDKGLDLGKADGSSAIPTYDSVRDLVTRTPLPAVGSDNIDTLLADGSIVQRMIHDGAVGVGKIAADVVGANEIAAYVMGVGKYIRSQGYVAGSSGWAIDSTGNAEFNNVTVRGTVDASTVTGSNITGGSFATAASGPRIIVTHTDLLSITFDVSGTDNSPGAVFAQDDGSGVQTLYARSPKKNSSDGRAQIYLQSKASGDSAALIEGKHIFIRAVGPGVADDLTVSANKIYGVEGGNAPALVTRNGSHTWSCDYDGTHFKLYVDNGFIANLV